MVPNIAIFASGTGSNAAHIIDTLHSKRVNVVRLYCNNPEAGVIKKCELRNVPVCVISKEDWNAKESSQWFNQLMQDGVSLIVLAGFLKKIPAFLIQHYPNKIINLHPALLPKFGGKGMYGLNVHRAVLQANEESTGISFHFVNEHYDEGAIIAQFEMYVAPSNTPEHLAERIHQLEHRHFPDVILSVLNL